MSIWKRKATLEGLNARNTGTIHEVLGIRFTQIGDDFLEASMPVGPQTVQPMGRLHGGASVVLAESLGSVAAILCCESESQEVVGVEINANHVRSARSGTVTGRATPVHIGSRLQVWEIRVVDEAQRLISVARLTAAVLGT